MFFIRVKKEKHNICLTKTSPSLYIVAKNTKSCKIILNGRRLMALMENKAYKLNIQLSDGKIIEFMPEMVHSDLSALTNNQEIIQRTERLILVQLSSYTIIKLRELQMIIYKTLNQLRYHQIASQYYNAELS